MDFADKIAGTAVRSLLYEVLVTPKPGLVDRNNNGAHSDMDVFTFVDSAVCLLPYFKACAAAGLHTRADALFKELRPLGVAAEADMRLATGGVNTHKGAIFSLGLLCAASGALYARKAALTPEALCALCAEAAGETLRAEMADINAQNARTHGERLLAISGLTGARGEVSRGFPSVLEAGLPALSAALEAGETINDAGVCALLRLMTVSQDTNFVKRSSLAAREAIIERLNKAQSAPVALAKRLDAEFIEKGISPGGSADLLAAVFFLHFIAQYAS